MPEKKRKENPGRNGDSRFSGLLKRELMKWYYGALYSGKVGSRRRKSNVGNCKME